MILARFINIIAELLGEALMREISRLTEKTAEIKSSEGKQLGIVREIAGNEIVMNVYVGKKGLFVLPKDMIREIRKKTIYLTLSKEEFESWWEGEGPLQVAEYPARLDVALGIKLVGADLEHLRKRIIVALEKNFGRDISKDRKERLCREQERIMQSFSSDVRKMLHSDEWVHYFLDLYERRSRYLSLDEDVFLVTSKRLIRFKSDGTKDDNWSIPIDSITSISSVKRRLNRWGTLILHKILFFEHQTEEGLRFERLRIPIERFHTYVPQIKIGSIEESIEKAISVPVSIEELTREAVEVKVPETELLPRAACPYCGHGNPSDAEFCIRCGRILE